jgi:group I intron endonuclease
MRVAKIERKRSNLALQAALCYNEATKYCGVQAVRQYSWTDRKYEFLPMNDIIPSSSGIYKITCTANKKIYIGSAVNLRDRKSTHWSKLHRNEHGNPKLQNAWNKYGPDAFTFETLELVLPMSLTAREQYWFNKLNPFDRKGFNIYREAGSPLGTKQTPEQIERMRQTKLGRKQTPEHIKNRTQQAIGRKHSPERIEKNKQTHLGKKLPPEQIEKMRQSHIGMKASPETIENMRQAQRGKKPSPKAIEAARQVNLGNKYHLGRQRDEEGRFV